MDVILSINDRSKRNVYLNNKGGSNLGESVSCHENGNDTGAGRNSEPVIEGSTIEIMINDRFKKKDESMRYCQFWI